MQNSANYQPIVCLEKRSLDAGVKREACDINEQ